MLNADVRLIYNCNIVSYNNIKLYAFKVKATPIRGLSTVDSLTSVIDFIYQRQNIYQDLTSMKVTIIYKSLKSVKSRYTFNNIALHQGKSVKCQKGSTAFFILWRKTGLKFRCILKIHFW